MAYNLRRNLFLLFLLLATITGANAQLIPGLTGKPAEETVEAPKDLLGRRTPRGTVNGFIGAIEQSNYLEASEYLQLNKKKWRRQSERIRIVTIIQKHLDQSGDIQPYGFISNKETGRTDDEFEEGNDLIGTITAGGQTISLMVSNTAGANEPALWLISAETVDEIMNISGDNDVLLNRVLPDVLKERRMGGVPIGHWFAVVIFILVAYLLSWAIVSLISYILRLIWRRSEDGKVASVIRAFELPFRLYLAVWIFVAVSQEAGISIIVRQRFSVITVTIGIVAILMLLWRITDVITVYTNDRMTKRKRVSAISIIMFLRRTSKVALVVIGIIAVLGALGVDVTA
ncbi:MAG: mechanosensitive ion channel family protein, partial [Flavobacterium sp.]